MIIIKNTLKIFFLLTLITTASLFVACSGASKGSTSAGNPQETTLPVTLSQLSDTGFLVITIPNEAVGESLNNSTLDILVNGRSRNTGIALQSFIDADGDARLQIGSIANGDEITLMVTSASGTKTTFIGTASATASTIAIDQTHGLGETGDLVKFIFDGASLTKIEIPKNLIQNNDGVKIGFSIQEPIDGDGTLQWEDFLSDAAITRGAAFDTLTPNTPVRLDSTDDDEVVLVIYRQPSGQSMRLVTSVLIGNVNQQGETSTIDFTLATDMYDTNGPVDSENVPLPEVHAMDDDEGEEIFSDGSLTYQSTCTPEFIVAYDYFLDRSLSPEEMQEQIDRGAPVRPEAEWASARLVTAPGGTNSKLIAFKRAVVAFTDGFTTRLDIVGGMLRRSGSVYGGKIILTIDGKMTETTQYVLEDTADGSEFTITDLVNIPQSSVSDQFPVAGTCGVSYTLHP